MARRSTRGRRPKLSRAEHGPAFGERAGEDGERAGTSSTHAEPADSTAPEANSHGRCVRASCHTGTAASQTNTAVYVVIIGANAARGLREALQPRQPTHLAEQRGAGLQAENPPSNHDHNDIGDVGLMTRSMSWKRSGRPRSEISSGGLTSAPRRRGDDRLGRSINFGTLDETYFFMGGMAPPRRCRSRS